MSDPTTAAATASPDAAGAITTAAAPATQPAAQPAIPPAAAPAVQPAATTPAVDAPAGAPEAYADFTLPEGVDLGALVDDARAVAKELNLPQDSAQKVVDLVAKANTAQATQQAAVVSDIHAQWAEQSKADKEFGGEKLAENLAIAKTAMDAVATPQLKVLLERTGLGNNPEVIRLFLKIAPAFAPDNKLVPNNAPPGNKQSAAKVLYPSMA